MTDILSSWLQHLNLSRTAKDFDVDLSNGYLFGEVLFKYNLQHDFNAFEDTNDPEGKLKNFTRLEPSLRGLNIPFSSVMANDIMNAKSGVAGRLLYQMRMALDKIEPLTSSQRRLGTTPQTAELAALKLSSKGRRSAARPKYDAFQSDFFATQLKKNAPRKLDQNLHALLKRFDDRRVKHEQTVTDHRRAEEERRAAEATEKRNAALQRAQENKKFLHDWEHMGAQQHAKNMAVRWERERAGIRFEEQESFKRDQAKAQANQAAHVDVVVGIESFEENIKRLGVGEREQKRMEEELQDPDAVQHWSEKAKTAPVEHMRSLRGRIAQDERVSHDEYLTAIQSKKHEELVARKEREKRRRKVLVEQQKAHIEMEERRVEDLLLENLLRQSREERRLTAELMQTRYEKEVMRQNRMHREEQYKRRRQVDFEEALKRDAEVSLAAMEEYRASVAAERQRHQELFQARQAEKYRRHYTECLDVLNGVLDITLKVAEYREMTDKLVPPQCMRDWKTLFLAGVPLYAERVSHQLQLDDDLGDKSDLTAGTEVGGEASTRAKEASVSGEEASERERPVEKGTDVAEKEKAAEKVPEKAAEKPSKGAKRTKETSEEPAKESKRAKPAQQKEEKKTSRKSEDEKQKSSDKGLTKSTESVDGLEAPTGDTVSTGVEGVGVDVDAVAEAEVAVDAAETRESTAGLDAAAEEGSESEQTDVSEGAVLDDTDLADYLQGCGEWLFDGEPEEPNVVIGNVVRSLVQITAPPPPPPPKPVLPAFPVKLAVLGKSFSGKTTVVEALAEKYILEVISAKNVVKEAIIAADAGEEIAEDTAGEGSGGRGDSSHRERREGGKKRDAKSKSKGAGDGGTLSVRASLGITAKAALLAGKEVEDDVVVKLIVERIRAIEGDARKGGWVLDGFPATLRQAQMLEKELSGFEQPAEKKKTGVRVQSKSHGKDKSFKNEVKKGQRSHSRITPPTKEEAKPQDRPRAGMDFVLRLDVDDSLALRRALGRRLDPVTGKTWHLEFNPPPVGSGVVDRLIPVEDPDNCEVQLQHHLHTYAAEDTAISAFYAQLDGAISQVLHPISNDGDGGPALESITNLVEEMLQTQAEEKRLKDEEEREFAEYLKVEEEESMKQQLEKDAAARMEAQAGQRATELGEAGVPEKLPETVEEEADVRDTDVGADGSALVSTHNVAAPDMNLALVLMEQWSTIESVFTMGCKHVFRGLRQHRYDTLYHMYEVKKDFVVYLNQPDDRKHVLVAEFQQSFNELDEDLRADPDGKAELHQRAEELKEALWEVCDKRMVEAENERANIINDRWLEDSLALIANHYITLMQMEVDRYQGTRQFANDYYAAMEGKPLEDVAFDAVVLPLVDIAPVDLPSPRPSSPVMASPAVAMAASNLNKPGTPDDRAGTPNSKAAASGSGKDGRPRSGTMSPKAKNRAATKAADKSAKAKSAKGSNKGAKGKGLDEGLSKKGADKKVRDGGKAGKNKNPKIKGAESSRPQDDLVQDLQNAAFLALSLLPDGKGDKGPSGKSPRRGKVGSADEKPKKDGEKKVDKKLNPGKDEKGKFSRASAKQNKQADADVVVEVSPLTLEAQEATRLDDELLRKRIHRLLAHGSTVLTSLNNLAEEGYRKLSDWLGARFRAEMGAVGGMLEYIRNKIEAEELLDKELVLEGVDCIIDEGIYATEPEPVMPPPPPREKPSPDRFTCAQLLKLCQQFKMVTGSTSLIPTTDFIDLILRKQADNAFGGEELPKRWLELPRRVMRNMAEVLDPTNRGYVDWREAVILLAVPRYPELDHLLMLKWKFSQCDPQRRGRVPRDDFFKVPLWLEEEAMASMEKEAAEFYRPTPVRPKEETSALGVGGAGEASERTVSASGQGSTGGQGDGLESDALGFVPPEAEVPDQFRDIFTPRSATAAEASVEGDDVSGANMQVTTGAVAGGTLVNSKAQKDQLTSGQSRGMGPSGAPVVPAERQPSERLFDRAAALREIFAFMFTFPGDSDYVDYLTYLQYLCRAEDGNEAIKQAFLVSSQQDTDAVNITQLASILHHAQAQLMAPHESDPFSKKALVRIFEELSLPTNATISFNQLLSSPYIARHLELVRHNYTIKPIESLLPQPEVSSAPVPADAVKADVDLFTESKTEAEDAESQKEESPEDSKKREGRRRTPTDRKRSKDRARPRSGAKKA